MNNALENTRGMVPQYALVAGVFVAFLSFVGIAVAPQIATTTIMRIEPEKGLVLQDDMFTVEVMVEAATPVNVFKGELHFDPTKLQVVSIDYNTSIAELWAERPWYANGEGTINFIGGTTKVGGILGTGALLTVTFESVGLGDAVLSLVDVRILAHDGFGNDVQLVAPLDALFTLEDPRIEEETVSRRAVTPAAIAVVASIPNTDLNGDGKQSLSDISIFIAGFFNRNPRLDFNGDGEVNTTDLSIIMSAP